MHAVAGLSKRKGPKMLPSLQVEELINLVSALDRDILIQQITQYPALFPIDFTADFFHRQPTDRLRHIFVALCIQHQKMPEMNPVRAA